MAANVSNTRVGIGQDMKIDLGAKNESSERIEFVSATLKESINWSSSGHHSHSKNQIVSKRFRITDAMKAKRKDSLREIKVEHQQSGVESRGFSDSVYREILDAVRDGANVVVLRIPSNVHNSYRGRLVTIEHYLSIKAKTPSCTKDPKIHVPLQIVSSSHPSITPTAPVTSVAAVPSAPLPGWDQSNVTTIPIVEATVIGPTIYGGDIVDGNGGVVSSYVVPSAPALPTEYTFQTLLGEIQSSLSVKMKLEDLLKVPQWKSIISALQPTEFVAILNTVMLDFDKVDIVNVLARNVNAFTCFYAVVVLRSVSNWLRIQIVQTMIPCIVDLRDSKSVLLNELSDWERISTEQDFEKALMQRI